MLSMKNCVIFIVVSINSKVCECVILPQNFSAQKRLDKMQPNNLNFINTLILGPKFKTTPREATAACS